MSNRHPSIGQLNAEFPAMNLYCDICKKDVEKAIKAEANAPWRTPEWARPLGNSVFRGNILSMYQHLKNQHKLKHTDAYIKVVFQASVSVQVNRVYQSNPKHLARFEALKASTFQRMI